MIIETKYNVGDVLVFISRETAKIEKLPAYKIEVSVGDYANAVSDSMKNQMAVKYWFYDGKNAILVPEEAVYKTVEELVSVLTNSN